jgi:hypothetical protein
MTRMEGVGSMTTMVLDGPSMDSLIQRLCINGQHHHRVRGQQEPELAERNACLLHLPLLGLPEERLKVLNGGENGWENAAAANGWAASYALTNAVPTVNPSTFSVKNLYVYNGSSTANFGVRTSIGEMLSIVDRINTGALAVDATGVAILDVRGGNPAVFVQQRRRGRLRPVFDERGRQHVHLQAGQLNSSRDSTASA